MSKHLFRGVTGYVVYPQVTGHHMVTVRHSDMVPPWADSDIHLHERSEEHYLLLHGTLHLLVDGSLLTLQANEILTVKPGFSHTVVGGEGLIEHFVIRAPAEDDRRSLQEIPRKLKPVSEDGERELRHEWGYRIPLQDTRNQNCWLIGVGSARFLSRHLILAYIDFATEEAASDGIGTRHKLHLHKESWEYYLGLGGQRTLRIEDEIVTLEAGEVLEVPPHVRHTLHGRQPPYRGLTFRVPVLDHGDKVEF